jgi:TRAP transporter TAXI family solute receptor
MDVSRRDVRRCGMCGAELAASQTEGLCPRCLMQHVLAELVPSVDGDATRETRIGPGARIGPYELLALLGRGGMGEVYLARDTRLDRKVALKLLPPELREDADRLRRFEQEARTASSLNHPSILTIYEIGQTNGTHFIATEFIEGVTLRAQLTGAPMAIDHVLMVAEQVGSALAAAHEAGIIHRDIKPENIIVRPDGLVKVLDFGLAKLIARQGTAAAAAAGAMVQTSSQVLTGTLPYMSPEQVLGRDVDHRSDLFSVGVLLYELTTGRLPFAAATMGETFDRILHGQSEPIGRVNPGVPTALQRIVDRCLEKDRARRYESARDLLSDLHRVTRDPDVSPKAFDAWRQSRQPLMASQPSNPVAHASRTVRHPWRWVAAASALVIPQAATDPAAGRVVERIRALARERRLRAVAVSVLVVVVAALAFALSRTHQPAPVRVPLTLAVQQKGAPGFEVGSGIVEAVRQVHGDLDVTLQGLEGSIGAAKLLDTGQAQLGFVNSVVAFHAVKTERVLGHRANFAGAAVVWTIPAQILVRRDASIASLQDLRGKRVSVGPPGVGEGFLAEILLSHFGLGPSDMPIIRTDVDRSLAAVLDGSLEAYISWRAAPVAEISKAMESGRLRLVGVDRELVDGLRLNHPFLIPLTIPKGMYRHQDGSVSTVSCKMLLVASRSVPPRVVDQILTAIATHIPDLIARHPIASEIDLRKRPTVADGMSIELHPGAEMFYERASRP